MHAMAMVVSNPNQAPPLVDHRRRIGSRENYLAVCISRRGCLLLLGVISGTGLLWKGSVWEPLDAAAAAIGRPWVVVGGCDVIFWRESLP